MRGVVVTGTDTGVGKTVVAALLLRALRRRAPDLSLRYWKPFQTGCPPDDDAATVAGWADLAPDRVVRGPLRLRMPASPHEAALAEGVEVRLPLRAPASPEGGATTWVVEGAGGLLVPLSLHATIADAFVDLGLPLVVVARPEVGTLNHTLLTLEAARARGLEVAAVIVSRPPTAAVLGALAAHAPGTPVLALPTFDLGAPGALEAAADRLLGDAAFGALVDRIARGGVRGGSARADLVGRDAASTWHPWTQHAIDGPPLEVVGARGAWLELADGRRVLDAISSWWTTLHGHGEPSIAAAIARQARALDHVIFAGATHEPGVALAERLLAAAPPGLARVFYSDDGSTAVETALKLALAYHARRGAPGRTRFLALEHGYHGDTAGAMSVSEEGPFTRDFRPLRFPCTRVPVPSGGRDESACLDALEATLAREGAATAALVAEPLLQGASGMRVHSVSFLRGLREATRRHGVLLVADEVLTGMGRTGALFACGRAGVTPDLLCTSKALTGGTLPLAATLATEEVWRAFLSPRREDAFLHGHSYTGNPIACAAALASLDLLEGGALARADAVGERIGRGIEGLRGRPGVADVRGIGLVRAVELEDPDGRGYLAPTRSRMVRAALDRGVLLRPLGPVVYALPPLGTTDGECDLVARALVAAVEAGLAGGPGGVGGR